MKLIELHILQSFPVSCLNRDDVGAPKRAVFGGVNRARLSSQSMKRAIREYAKEMFPQARFNGQRTKLIVGPLCEGLQKHGLSEEAARQHALKIADKLGTLDDKKKHDQTTNFTFLGPSETDAITREVAELVKKDPKAADYEKKLDKFCKAAGLMDGADIAVFGRMVTSLPLLTLEGAAMFSHALSTHKSDNDLDFYSAVDDLKPEGNDAGAGMIGMLEFASAVYYRYGALNLDLLADAAHLGGLDAAARQTVVDAFIRSTLLAVPGARKNSMNANTVPGYALGIYKEAGQPVQLINAFEKPIRSATGLLEPSREAMLSHHEQLKKTWGFATNVEIAIPDSTLDAFCQALTRHVH